MANFTINPEELIQGMQDPERVISAGGDIFEEQKGITPDQVAALDALMGSLIGPADEGGSFESLGDIVSNLSPEQAAIFTPPAKRDVPNYLAGALPGDLPSGDPNEYNSMMHDPYYKEKIQHPGTFEEYVSSQPEARRAGIKLQEKRFFLQSQFPEVEGDISQITSSKKIQSEIFNKADEYAESVVDSSYHQILSKEYQLKIQPILESLNYIEDKDDYNATLNLLTDLKTSITGSTELVETVVNKGSIFSNDQMAEFLSFPKERQDAIKLQMNEDERNELLSYKKSRGINLAGFQKK